MMLKAKPYLKQAEKKGQELKKAAEPMISKA